MARARRRCKKCRRQFTPLTGNRVNCYLCRPARGGAAVMQFPPANRDDEPVDETVVALTAHELRQYGRLGTWQGRVAIRIAERIDAGSHTMAQDVKALREQMAIALAGVEKSKPDKVDQIFGAS